MSKSSENASIKVSSQFNYLSLEKLREMIGVMLLLKKMMTEKNYHYKMNTFFATLAIKKKSK